MGKPIRVFELNPVLVEKFWDRAEPSGDPAACWGWSGNRNQAGYGQLHIGGKSDRMALSAHRVSWMIERGNLPGDQLVLHRCDNPPCTNPRHLFLGDHQANHDDMRAKGRNAPAPLTGVRGDAHPRAKRDGSRERALVLAAAGHSHVAIAAELGCHRTSVSRWLEEVELEAGRRLVPSATMRRTRPAGQSPTTRSTTVASAMPAR